MPQRTIDIVEYDPAWPALFEREADRIRSVVADEVISIEHVGSTSIPGLAAKPIVDICPVVEDMETARAVSHQLDQADWPLVRERGTEPWIEHERIAQSGQEYNVHIRPRRSAIESYLLLREYLRDHPEIRDEYARVKREAARQHPNDVGRYTEAKSEIIELIKERARKQGYPEHIDL